MAKKNDKLRIEYHAISHLQKWPSNPKKHDIHGITAAIERFGFVDPIVIDEKSGKMVAGHGRLESLAGMKGRKKPVPKRIIEKDGEWYAPVLRGHDFENEEEAEAFLVADNRLVEIGGWHKEREREILRKHLDEDEIQLAAMGWAKHRMEQQVNPRKYVPPDEQNVGTKTASFVKSEVRQIVLSLKTEDFVTTGQQLKDLIETQKLANNAEALFFLLNFYESRTLA